MAKDLEYYLAQARRIAAHREANAEKEIRKLYKSMLKDLQQFMGDTYLQYAEDDKLTFGMLQKAGYDARFLSEIEQRINLATPKAAQELKELVEKTYEAAYTEMVKGVAKKGGLDAAFFDAVAITPEQVKAAVENPVSGLTLSDVLEKNRKDVIYNIKKAVGVGLMNGDRYTTMAKRIAEYVDNDYKKAVTIARTETHRVREAGNVAAAQAVDKEMQNGTSGMRMTKTWKTMKDERVRPQQRRKGKKGWKTRIGKGANHMQMEGQTVLANEKFLLGNGVEADAPGNSGDAGNDINCRCYASYEMMDDETFFKKTGRHFGTGKEHVPFALEEPHTYAGEGALNTERTQAEYEKLKKQLEKDAGRTLADREVKDMVDAMDYFFGGNYTDIIAAQHNFGGLFQGYSTMMNEANRKRALKAAADADKFLETASKYSGKAYRGMAWDIGGDYDDGAWRKLTADVKVGDTIEFGNITSWTKERSWLGHIWDSRAGLDEEATGQVWLELVIGNSKTGVDVSDVYKLNPSQHEVTFGSKTGFKVTKVEKKITEDDWYDDGITKYTVWVEEA